MRFFLIVIVVFSLDFSLLQAATDDSGGIPTVRLRVENWLDTIDPNRSIVLEGVAVANQVFDTLVVQTEIGDFKPGLAESWSFDSGCTWQGRALEPLVLSMMMLFRVRIFIDKFFSKPTK